MKLVKYLAINGIVLLVLTVVLLGATEAYLRFTIPSSTYTSIFEWTLDNSRHKVMKKNFRVSSWGTELRTNNLGFRDDRDTVPPKGDGEFRAIVLGDSFSLSGGVPYDKIYSSLLEQRIAERYPDTDVINLAVGGYNPVQYQAVLEEVGLALRPDLIIVGLFPRNDFNRGRAATQELNYRRAAFGEDLPQEHGGFRSLYVYRAFLWRFEAKFKALFAPAPKPSDAEKDDSGWPDNAEALGQMARRAEELGIPFLVVVLPHNWGWIEHRELIARALSHCEEQRIECIDTLEAFIASGRSEPAYRLNLIDSHPNARYHALVADVLAPRVLEFVPER